MSSPGWRRILPFVKQSWDPQQDKEHLLIILHWFRQLFAVICGVVWGLIPILGWIGIISYIVLSMLAVYIYYTRGLHINAEDFGGMKELLQEGFMSSFALFLVTWIAVYNVQQAVSVATSS
jgi:heme/copper-type cytochrome/quinol oxidase subunit 2